MEGLILKSYAGEVKDVDSKGVIVKAVNAFGNRDAAGDVSMKGSFTKTLQEGLTRVRWFLNHKRDVILGVPLEGHQTEEHLIMKSRINLNKQVGRDTYEDYKMYAAEGRSLEHSVGVIAMPGKFEKKGDTRYVAEWRMMEYSTLTDWGANENTPVFSIKSAHSEETPLELIEFLEKSLRVANYSDMKGKQIESHILQIKALMQPAEVTEEPQTAIVDYKSVLSNFKLL